MKSKSTIYVVTHKKVDLAPLKLDSCYRLIRVGTYGKEENSLLSDRTGESIAEKNPNYCELTALYWIWKNDTESDIVGLCHYRRFFTTAWCSTSPQYILREHQLQKLLKDADIIVAEKEYSYRGAYQAYLDCGREKDLIETESAIRKLYPEYLEAFDTEFKNSAGGYPANMMICPKQILDQYCQWLFSILEEVEKNTSLEGYSVQEARIYGYLSERLLGVWLAKQNLRVLEMRILNTEQKLRLPDYLREAGKRIGFEPAVKKLVYGLKKNRK